MGDATITLPIIIAIIGLLSAPVTVTVTWFVNRRKNTAELYAAMTGASQDAVETMATVVQELREQVRVLSVENKELRKHIAELQRQIRVLESNIVIESRLFSGESTGELPVVDENL